MASHTYVVLFHVLRDLRRSTQAVASALGLPAKQAAQAAVRGPGRDDELQGDAMPCHAMPFMGRYQ